MDEEALLRASFEAVVEPKSFHCATCITQYGDSERMMQKAFTARRSKGCFDFNTKAYRLGNIRYNTCIGNFARPIEYLIEAFTLYEKGILPFKGTIGQQPSKLMEVFELFARRRNEKIDSERAKQAHNSSRKGTRGR